MDERFMTERASAMQILESGGPSAALYCREMVEFGTLDEKVIPVNKRIESIWDLLDRTGARAPRKVLVARLDAADLIARAYEKKHKSGGQTQVVEKGEVSKKVEPPEILLLPAP